VLHVAAVRGHHQQDAVHSPGPQERQNLLLARRLIVGADVLVENFRPGVMNRLGLGAAEMSAANPRLVYCSLPGFAEDDPRASMPAWEGVIKAASGTYRRNREGEPPGAPVYTALPIASTFAAEQAAIAITMALHARERDGVGQRISVPLFDAMFAAIGYQGLRLHTPPARQGAGGIGLGGTFRCKDGRWVYFGTGNDNTPQVIEALGATSWVADGLFDRERVAGDPSLRDTLRERARALFLTRDAEEWERIISAAGGE
jgi:crotonobetainyl-CoA:carnitine CoA-transferase CaiB-like acyl-CoA transferase